MAFSKSAPKIKYKAEEMRLCGADQANKGFVAQKDFQIDL